MVERPANPLTGSKSFSGARRFRPLWIASFLAAVCTLGFGPALADSDSVNDGAKKVGKGFGELLKGMGQEVKKAGGSLGTAGKNDNKKEKKRPDNEPGKGK